MIILDASVALKWFVPNEPGRVMALHVLDAIAQHPDQFAVPELFFNEMLSVLCRTKADKKIIASYMTDLEALGFSRIGNGHEVLYESIMIAFDFHLSGYDAIYAACAKLSGGRWLTADEKACAKLRHTKLGYLLKTWSD